MYLHRALFLCAVVQINLETAATAAKRTSA